MKTIKSLQLPLIVLLANLCILFNSCNGVSGSIKNFTGYQSGSSVVLTWDYTGDYQGMIFSLYRNGERADYWSYSLDTWGEGDQICIDNSPSGGPNISYRIEYENPDGYEVFATASTVVYYDNNNSGNNDNNNNGGSNDNNNNNNNDGNNDNNQTGELDRPTGLNASAQSESVALSWNSVSGASGYYVYRSSSSSGYYDKIGTVTSTYYTDYSPLEGKNYYKVKAYNYYSSTESSYSDYVVCSFTKKEEVSKPEAPTGVSAVFTGSIAIPSIKISWNYVSGATSYKVYRSTSAYGTYRQIGDATSSSYLYDNDPYAGNNYYKVKAYNEAGESGYSDYASCSYDPNDVSPCPVQYGNCSATSTTITLRWTNPTTSGCGKPDKAILRVRNPESGQYADLQTLSGTATSASFAFGMWLSDDGYVYCGIITENEHGSSGGVAKVYDYNNKRWIN